MSRLSDPRRASLNILLERIDPGRKMARFYVLSIEPTLFGDHALTRGWGRIGSKGRQRREFFADDASAGVALESWLARKRRRGYCTRISRI